MDEGYHRVKYKIELSLENTTEYIYLPCGFTAQKYIILEDIWEQTGCDIPKERGKWYCCHCSDKYFFYLF